jgi:hypothetical protein
MLKKFFYGAFALIVALLGVNTLFGAQASPVPVFIRRAMDAPTTTPSDNDTLLWSTTLKRFIFGAATNVTLSNTTIADVSYTGIAGTFSPGEDLVGGDIVYVKSDGKVWRADANAVTSTPAIGLATTAIASTTSGVILFQGFYRNNTRYNFATGSVIYVSTDVGKATTTQPSATDDLIQNLGVAVGQTILYFNPDLLFLNHS